MEQVLVRRWTIVLLWACTAANLVVAALHANTTAATILWGIGSGAALGNAIYALLQKRAS